MQRPTYMKDIESRIECSPDDSLFVYSDFSDIASNDVIRKAISRLEGEGKLQRVLAGIYGRPRYNTVIQDDIPPHPDNIAQTLARKYRWSIAPVGDTALNQLGLSTQVPYVMEYVSNGPYRNYQLGNVALKFLHSASRELSGLKPTSALVVQAIKALGKDGVSENDINTIANRLTDEDKKILLDECRQTTVWVYEIIKEICQR